VPEVTDLRAPASASPTLGARMREIRRRLNLTLTQVSERTGIAISTLSKVENNLMSLTYDKVVQFAECLGVDIVELFAQSRPLDTLGKKSFTPANEGWRVPTPIYDYNYVCADIAGKKMVPIIVEVNARTLEEFGPLSRHSGDEYGYVIRGSVEFHSDFYKPIVMSAGSSIYFDARMGHAYTRIGDAPATILCVCTAPESELHELADREALIRQANVAQRIR
jgi:transcriptional regulator with XRE-family HTH domain